MQKKNSNYLVLPDYLNYHNWKIINNLININYMFSQKILQSTVIYFFLFTALLSEIIAQSGNRISVHDPCIIKRGEYYYIFSTGDRININRSTDLLNWKSVGSVFSKIPAWGVQEVPGVSNIWAPDIFLYKGKYYLFYSLSTFGSNNSRIGLAVNTTLDPNDSSYNWIDEGKVIQSKTSDNFNAIDPNIVLDQTGRIWLSFGSFWNGIKLVELDSNTFKPIQNYNLYSIASRSGGAIEAPYIVFKNGFYYLFVSFDFCCQGVNSTYNIRVGRSQDITGPYLDSKGTKMMSGGGTLLLSGDSRWKGPGHCAVLLQEQGDWLIYHAYDTENNGRPTLRISRLNWNTDGWPVVDTEVNVEELINLPGSYFLFQNYPNPFNPSTTINYSIPAVGTRHPADAGQVVVSVQLKVYDVLGCEVATLVNEQKSPGNYQVQFNSSGLASGVYMYIIQAGNYFLAKKMIVLK